MPSISLVHYPAIYPEFRKVCAKHDCLPMDAGSMVYAIMSHWKYVHRLGRGEFAPDNAAQTVSAGRPGDIEAGKTTKPAEAPQLSPPKDASPTPITV